MAARQIDAWRQIALTAYGQTASGPPETEAGWQDIYDTVMGAVREELDR